MVEGWTHLGHTAGSQMNYEVTIGDRTFAIGVVKDGEGYLVRVRDSPEQRVDVRRPEPSVWSVLQGDYCYEVGLVERDSAWDVDIYGSLHHCAVVDSKRKALRLGGGSNEGLVSTSMPGRIVRVLVGEGAEVVQGEPILIVEAMKMENEIKAPIDGVVAEIMVGEGDTVETGTKLARIQGE